MGDVTMVLRIIMCLFAILPGLLVNGKQTAWGHRDFKVRCDSGARLTGHTLRVLGEIKSKSRCLTRCFVHPDCQSINYYSKMKECQLNSASKDASSSVDWTVDETFVYCGRDDGDVWERTAKTKLIPDIDDCLAASCLNGGTCNDGIYSFTCACVAGYTGTSCETDIDECSPSPCMNGATCAEGVDSFQCTCVAGYTGTSCETNIDECSPSPCMNGATCAEGVDSFQCTCVAGYTGISCETNINDCSPDSCKNGGTCADGVNSFTCACVTDYTGTFCETKPLLRLVGGPGPNSGRVEVYHGGQWGTVCDDRWDKVDADVTCRQAGYPYASQYWGSAHYGQGTEPILLDNTDCLGSERALHDCPHAGWTSHDCSHTEDSSVECYLINNAVRLVGGASPNEGRVEVLYSWTWGTVCDDGWSLNDGHVVCKQLGYQSASDAWHSAHFGQGTGHIHLDDVACTGTETSLWDCSHLPWGSHDCHHGEDASVRCNIY